MKSKRYINIITGVIVEQVPILEMAEYEEYEGYTKDDVMADIRKANKEIIKRHKYVCGLVPDEKKAELGCGDMFFESPDGQNSELFYELKRLGYRTSGYNAEYDWGVSKQGWKISFCEGDIYIKKLN